jgi:hypothetical protein
MKQLSKLMREQADPVFALLQAQKDLKKAQATRRKAIKTTARRASQARAATEKLVDAAIDLQGAVGDVGTDFNGKLARPCVNDLKAAGLTKTQIAILKIEFGEAKKAADKYNGKYEALTTAPGAPDSKKQLGDAHTAAELFDGSTRPRSASPATKRPRPSSPTCSSSRRH